jgi:type IV pilus assembly protein PilE
MNNKNQGFTLMELMVSVSIIAILMAIAVPRYQQSVIRNNRVAVQAEMMQIAGLMEGVKARQMTYGTTATPTTLADLGRSTSFPSSGTANYTLELTMTDTGIGWMLTATPQNRQATALNGRLALDSLGRQCWSSGNNSGCNTESAMVDPANAWSSSR